VALNALDYAASVVGHGDGARRIEKSHAEDALQQRTLSTDKAGDSHYNLISAMIKSLRASDVDASLYYLARLVEAGEDPLFIARRLVIFASEDVGNADPRGLMIATAAASAVRLIGYPECRLSLSQAVTYLALAPKSNAAYKAYESAARAVRDNPPYAVPLHICNAPTRLMKDLGYGKDYKYPHDYPEAFVADAYLPPQLQGSRFYEPKDAGFEAKLRERLTELRNKRSK